jgi:pimeloyl-ACP methyl ester carboxylesterase
VAPEPTAFEVEAGGLTFRAVSAGEGERLVLLLHGFPTTQAMWEPVLGRLAIEGRRVVSFDQRGYSPGARPEAVEEYGRTQLVGDVIAVADALDAGEFDLVGHDWGGAVAWGVAAAHPDRVRTVTSVSTPHPDALVEAFGLPSGDQLRRSAYMGLFSDEVGKAETVLLDPANGGLAAQYAQWGMDPAWPGVAERIDRYVKLLTEPGALTGALNWYRRGSEWTGVGQVTVPALYLWPTDDVALGPEAAELTARYMDGPYRYVELDGISHWAIDQDPDRIVTEMEAHLNST